MMATVLITSKPVQDINRALTYLIEKSVGESDSSLGLERQVLIKIWFKMKKWRLLRFDPITSVKWSKVFDQVKRKMKFICKSLYYDQATPEVEYRVMQLQSVIVIFLFLLIVPIQWICNPHCGSPRRPLHSTWFPNGRFPRHQYYVTRVSEESSRG